ncbi:MAG: hypothetical protein ACFCVD_09900 [Nodosilinea sp.]
MPRPTTVLTRVLQASGFLVIVLLAPASALAQTPPPLEPLLESWSESGRPAIADISNQQTQTPGLAAVEPALEPPANVAKVPGDDDLDGSLKASEVVTGVEEATDSAWVADSLPRLDQAVVAQALVPSSDAQADPLGLLSSSTDSRDLQPMELLPVREDLFHPPLAQSLDITETTSTRSHSEQWHVLFVPYIYVPLSISGSVNFSGTKNFTDNFSRDFNLSRDFEFVPSQIVAALKESLNFAFFGGIEAWTPDYTLGILGNLNYLSTSSSSTFTREVRFPGLANFIPSELTSALNTQLWTADLAASYRFYDPAKVNPEGVYTEFDLGPFVFDVLGGLNVTSVNTQLGLTTNLGGNGQFTSSNTIFSPLLGGRFRWNANPRLAVLASGSLSGFGIGGLMQYQFQGGVDWIFSGNTSLGLGYRFSSLDYTQSAGNFNLSADQSGPYLDFGFRF